MGDTASDRMAGERRRRTDGRGVRTRVPATGTGWAFFNADGYLGTVTFDGEVIIEDEYIKEGGGTPAALDVLHVGARPWQRCLELGRESCEHIAKPQAARSEHDESPVEEKCRNRVDADRLRLLCRALDLAEIHRGIVDDSLDLLGIQAHLRQRGCVG